MTRARSTGVGGRLVLLAVTIALGQAGPAAAEEAQPPDPKPADVSGTVGMLLEKALAGPLPPPPHPDLWVKDIRQNADIDQTNRNKRVPPTSAPGHGRIFTPPSNPNKALSPFPWHERHRCDSDQDRPGCNLQRHMIHDRFF